jgi:hypothetical protein
MLGKRGWQLCRCSTRTLSSGMLGPYRVLEPGPCLVDPALLATQPFQGDHGRWAEVQMATVDHPAVRRRIGVLLAGLGATPRRMTTRCRMQLVWDEPFWWDSLRHYRVGGTSMTTEPSRYGRSSDEWMLLAESATAFLIERAKLRRVTSYTELNATLMQRTGLRGFDFDRQDERTAMGYLLGLVVQDNYPETHLMLSALVNYLDSNDAGPGFYVLAEKYGLLPRRASADTKWTFWVGQVSAVHDYYARNA